MSGELKDPRKNIIHGTLAAVLIGFVVYVILAYWFSRQASSEVLLDNTAIIFNLSLWKPLTLAGIFGAILSSSLSTLVGAPRILAALEFRPRLSFSILVPVAGFLGCIAAMILINSYFTLITFLVIISIYYYLSRKHLVSPWGDVRGGVFTALAEWAAQKAMSMPYRTRVPI